MEPLACADMSSASPRHSARSRGSSARSIPQTLVRRQAAAGRETTATGARWSGGSRLAAAPAEGLGRPPGARRHRSSTGRSSWETPRGKKCHQHTKASSNASGQLSASAVSRPTAGGRQERRQPVLRTAAVASAFRLPSPALLCSAQHRRPPREATAAQRASRQT